MPIPTQGETKEDFIARCIPMVINEGTTDDPSQAAAICYSKWENKDKLTETEPVMIFNKLQLDNNMKKLPIHELLIDDETGVECISLVEFPAIEIDYMKFSEQTPIKFSITDEDEQIFCGPALVPNKYIYRIDPKTQEEFYVFFSEKTVKQISEKYLIEHKQSNVNLEHSLPVNNVYLIESWIVKDPKNDKSNVLGYKDLPVGTWMVSLKCTDKELWNTLKDSDFNGFSIEGNFIQASKQEELSEDSINYDEILLKIKDILLSVE